MSAETHELVAIVLAAGGSTRMGRPKQLIVYEGRTLLARCVEAVSEVCDATVVVTGAVAERIAAVLPAAVGTVHNARWSRGLGSSLACAVSRVAPDCAAVLIALPDQPFVRREHFAALARAWRERPDHIVSAAYAGTRGAPAILPRRLFGALASLTGDRGAAALIANDERVIALALPAAAIDLDHPEDLDALEPGAAR